MSQVISRFCDQITLRYSKSLACSGTGIQVHLWNDDTREKETSESRRALHLLKTRREHLEPSCAWTPPPTLPLHALPFPVTWSTSSMRVPWEAPGHKAGHLSVCLSTRPGLCPYLLPFMLVFLWVVVACLCKGPSQTDLSRNKRNRLPLQGDPVPKRPSCGCSGLCYM